MPATVFDDYPGALARRVQAQALGQDLLAVREAYIALIQAIRTHVPANVARSQVLAELETLYHQSLTALFPPPPAAP